MAIIKQDFGKIGGGGESALTCIYNYEADGGSYAGTDISNAFNPNATESQYYLVQNPNGTSNGPVITFARER